jgi:O-methyltransferase
VDAKLSAPSSRERAGQAPAGSLEEIRGIYIDLLIGAVTHTLYAGVDRVEPPEAVVEGFRDALLASDEVREMIFDFERGRAEGMDWPQYAQSMVGLKRMGNVRRCVETILRDGVPGDLIEAGVWRGGVAILMRGILKAYGVDDRAVWLADSFQGLPAPDTDRFPEDATSSGHEFDVLAASADEVRDNFRRYGLLDERVRFVEGWFRDTLPALRDRTWSLVRLDGDMYEATMDGLVNLYDGLSPGGFLVIDDFALPPCRQAVEEFRRDRGIAEPIERIDWTGVFWRKQGS